MQLDNTKYKVYIHNIDDELSASDSESDDGKLIFLPDIEKRIRNMRIPRSVLADGNGELAGISIGREVTGSGFGTDRDRQLVLYSVPSSLTLPEEKDSVRKAIIETRARAREVSARMEADAQTEADTSGSGGKASAVSGTVVSAPATTAPLLSTGVLGGPPGGVVDVMENDPDAMDLS